MIISLDTELINSMASLSYKVSEEMNLCISVLRSTVEHNDWNCKERDMINDSITAVKKGNEKLSEIADAFANVMRQTADGFNVLESSIPNSYQHLDTMFGTQLSIPLNEDGIEISNVGEITNNIASDISENTFVSGGIQNYSLGNLTETIKMCDFSDVNFKE